MAIETGVGLLFLEELPLGTHVLSEGTPDTIKVALYGPDAILSNLTQEYTTLGEVSGGGYSAGGDAVALTVVGALGSARAGGVQFDRPYIQPSADLTITAAGVGIRGFMIYNSSKNNRCMFVGDFGETRTPASGIEFQWAVGDITQFSQVLIPLTGVSF